MLVKVEKATVVQSNRGLTTATKPFLLIIGRSWRLVTLGAERFVGFFVLMD